MFALSPRYQYGNAPEQHPSAVLVGDLSSSVRQQPVLLTEQEVQKLTHEFGHILHWLLARCDINYYNNIFNLPPDFIDIPAITLQQVVTHEKVLSSFAEHYKTGKPPPDSIFQKREHLQSINRTLSIYQQLFYSRLDVALHNNYNPPTIVNRQGEKSPTDSVCHYWYRHLSPYADTLPPSLQTSFPHLAQRPSRYYHYLWSKVYARDISSRLINEGQIDQQEGKRFRHQVLMEKGAKQSIRKFLGRSPRVRSFVNSIKIPHKESF